MKSLKSKNGTRYSLATKREALTLRKAGKTHREIVKILNISLGAAHLWTRDVVLSKAQKQSIQERKAQKVYTPERRRRLSLAASKHLKAHQFKQKHTKESLLKKIRQFYSTRQRIPLKREFGDPKIYRFHFGTWNNAIKQAGFKPNPVLFADKFISKDGHSCDSFTEKIIDDWLSDRGIEHKRHIAYSGTKMTADFLIRTNVIIEFFGLAGAQKHYDSIIQRKRQLCNKLGLELIEIYPKDLFPENRLSSLIN